jgi:hypothetical protein
VAVLGVPEDCEGEEEAEPGCCTLDGVPLVAGRVGEAEVLLEARKVTSMGHRKA